MRMKRRDFIKIVAGSVAWWGEVTKFLAEKQ
jgi:hypothetical protein